MSEENSNEMSEGLSAVAAVAGEATSEPTPDEGDLEYSIFTDPDVAPLKGKKKPYTMSVRIGSTILRGVLYPPELCKKYNREIMKLQKEAKKADEAIRKFDDDDLSAEEIEEAKFEKMIQHAEVVAEQMVALNESVILRSIRDWENPNWKKAPPCNADNLKKMNPEVKAALVDEIITKSVAGRSRSGFLEVS